MGGSLAWNLHELEQDVQRTATVVARTVLEKDLAFHNWASSHGGVYVPPSEITLPNPYLTAPNRDVVTTPGMALTLMNPAYVLRDAQQNFYTSSGIKSHLTGLKHLNPGNAPDDWERNALQSFASGSKEVLVQSGDQSVLRLMQPVYVNHSCLKCHAAQDYKVGDMIGGIGAAIPLRRFRDNELTHKYRQFLWHGMILLAGLLGLGAGFHCEKLNYKRLKADFMQIRQTEDSLLNAKRLLEETEQIGKVGGWEFAMACGKLTWTNEVYRIHEMDTGDEISLEKAIGFYTPASRVLIEEAVQRALKQGEPFDLKLEIITAKGNLRNVHAIGAMKQERVHGFFQDITEQTRVLQALKDSELRYERAVSGANDGLWEWNISTGEDYLSPRWKQLLGYQGQELPNIFTSFNDRIHPADQQRVSEAIRAHFEEHKPFLVELRLRCKSGEYRWFISRGNAQFDEQGQPMLMSGFITDISERKRVEDLLAEQFDELRRWRDSMLSREMRVIELKHEVNELLGDKGPRYPCAA